MNEITFTIITPSYNYGRYIAECLASVASQEGVTFEHLVMDAGSTDETAEVVARYPHASFFQQPDKGMSDGINKGFQKAKGKWLMWLNADDRMLPGALKGVKEHSETHPEADVIYGCWNFMDAAGNYQRTMTIFPYVRSMMPNHGCYIASTSTYFRRDTTIAEGFLLDIDFRVLMDGEYYCRLSYAGKKFSYLPRVLADFRLHDESISQRNIGKIDMAGILAYQHQCAESRAIRRMYGIKLFKDEMANCIVDGFLYHGYRVLKGVLKLIYRPFVEK